MYGSTSRSGESDYDGATAVGDSASFVPRPSPTKRGNAFLAPEYPLKPKAAPVIQHVDDLPFVDSATYFEKERPELLHQIGKGGVVGALKELDAELIQKGLPALISNKNPHELIGREVNPGHFGLYEYASSPKLLIKPGRYPGTPISNWIGCNWRGTFNLASNFPPVSEKGSILVPDEKFSKLGLTVVQVSQNQAAVILDPQMRVFVISDGGFVAMATKGAYKVLGLVDKTHLRDAVIDRHSKQVLGHTQTVCFPSGYVAATFLDIPANNIAILQRGNELHQLTAGQHCLTTPGVSIRQFLTLGEVQQELQADNIYTRDSVPVWLRIYLRYQLREPILLARHGYPTPFDALQDKTRSILTQIIAHLDYATMARTRTAAPEGNVTIDHEDDVGAVFVSAVRTQATDELKIAASEYGIQLEDLAIIDRKFKGEIAAKLDSLTTRALEAQVESANLDRENANKRRKQEGDAKVQELQNSMKRAVAETEAANKVQAAHAWAEAHMIEAEAMAKATKLKGEAAAEAMRIQARIDTEIKDDFARMLLVNRIEVERTKAYGNNTVFAPTEALSNGGMIGMGVTRGALPAVPHTT